MAKAPFIMPTLPKDPASVIGIRTPTWGKDEAADKIKATWLGHACFLVELPAVPSQSRGLRVLFDPVFSHRCSPFQWLGPARFTRE
jgi:N-acyl-phosphatidylethanolamine-hydrolysing phospholipase D